MVTLSWTASSGALTYTVKRSLTSGGPYQTWYGYTTTDTTLIDNGLENGTTYYYVVSAKNDHGESPDSTEVSATPVLPPPPAAPTGLIATGGKAKVNLRWTQSSTPGISYNSIYRATTSGGPYSLVANTSGPVTSYTDAGLASGKTYYYVVAATKRIQESAKSNQASATTK
jgi:cellulose 1,4-beta-cellobiosidase